MRQTMTRLLLMAVMTAMAMQAGAETNEGRERMEREMNTFLKSDGLKAAYYHNGKGCYEHYFKYVCNDAETADTSFVPAALKRLQEAFQATQPHTISSFSHDIADGSTPIRAIVTKWADNYFKTLNWYFAAGDSLNFRFSTYFVPDTMRTLYGLAWSPVVFKDRTGRTRKTIDGYVFKLQGNHWQFTEGQFLKDLYANRKNLRLDGEFKEQTGDTLANAIFKKKMEMLCRAYRVALGKKNNETLDAVAYSLLDVAKEFKGKLMLEDAQALKEKVAGLERETKKKERASLLRHTYAEINHKTSNKRRTIGHVAVRLEYEHLYTKNMIKGDDMRCFNSVYVFDDDTRNNRFPWTIKGTSRPERDYLQLTVRPATYEEYKAKAKNGRFTFTTIVSPNEFANVMDDKDDGGWWVIVDKEPTEINMADGTITGSDVNKRFIEYQRRIKNLERERRLYIADNFGNPQVIDTVGYHSLIDATREVMLEAIIENPDNLIPAFFLSQTYQEWPYETLKKVMSKDANYADHPSMRPVWQYFEGLEKRQPGCKFIDATLEDPDGKEHKLSEYIGKGNYVLMNFWSVSDGRSRGELAPIRKIINENKGKPLTVVSIYTGNDRKDWKDYIEKRSLKWVHLSNNKWFGGEAIHAYGVNCTPTTIIFAPDGTVITDRYHHERLIPKMREILKNAR